MTRRELGIAAYARIFGVPEEDVAAAFAQRVGPTFAEEAIQMAGGPAWSNPALTDRERGIAIITAVFSFAHSNGGRRPEDAIGWLTRLK
jgi:4-carboxymuconolactone decarboxylase